MSSNGKMVKLRSEDGVIFEVQEAVAVQSPILKEVIKEVDAPMIPVMNVTGKILSKVIEYCQKHISAGDEPVPEEINKEIKEWDAKFVNVDQNTLFDLILAANYMDIKGLLDLTCETVADMMRGKSPEQIRAKFNIKNDFTPEEEEEVRRENQWAFDN